MENILSRDKPCPNCGRYACRAITVDAIIASQAGILLIKRGNEPYKGYWALPGGHVDWDETVEDAGRYPKFKTLSLRYN
jgi:8-oxo-dGTP diphosphatase